METDDNLSKAYLLVFTEIADKFKFINKTKEQQKTSNEKQKWFILKIIYTPKESKEKKKKLNGYCWRTRYWFESSIWSLKWNEKEWRQEIIEENFFEL